VAWSTAKGSLGDSKNIRNIVNSWTVQVKPLTRNQASREQLEEYIIQTVKRQRPETAEELIKLVQQTRQLPEEEITELLIQLENEDRIRFTEKEARTPASPREYAFSSKAAWYWTTIALALATTITVFTIPEDAYPIVYVRSFLGVIFVLFLPGFTFMKALFPTGALVKTPSENMDTIVRAALSLRMRLALVPIVGLLLNYTPWGIRLTPITLSLLALTMTFATAAVIREHQTKTKNQL